MAKFQTEMEYWEKPPPGEPKGPTPGDVWAMEHPEYMTDEYLRGLWYAYAGELEEFLHLHPDYREVMPIKSLAAWIQTYLKAHPDYTPKPTHAVMPPRPDIGPGSKRPTPEMEELYYKYHPEARGTGVIAAEIWDWYQHQQTHAVMPPRPEWPGMPGSGERKIKPTGKLSIFGRERSDWSKPIPEPPTPSLDDYPRPPQPNIPTPKPEYPTPGRPVKPRALFENIWAWRKKKPLWW